MTEYKLDPTKKMPPKTEVTLSVPSANQLADEKDMERVRLIQRTVAVGTTRDELMMFLYQAHKSGLDPLARQIHIIVRGQGDRRKATIQASIDGLRLVAERSGKYAGQDAPEFEETAAGQPIKASVKVYKFAPDGQRYCAAVGVAHWTEYKPAEGSDFMWKKMPHTMLAKVAEALALRKAFPQDLSGIYSDDEMAQIDVKPIGSVANPSTKPQPTDNQLPAEDKASEDSIIQGNTVSDEPPESQMVSGYRAKIETIDSEAGLKIIQAELESKPLSDHEKETINQFIKDRRQHFADVALGVTKEK